MLISSVLDPNILTELGLSLVDYAQHIARSHVLVCDKNNVIEKGLLAQLSKLNGLAFERLNAAISPQRIVRIPHDQALLDSLSNDLECMTDSATALSLSGNDKVDVVLASELAVLALEEKGICAPKVMAYSAYQESPYKQIEQESCSSQSLNQISQENFSKKIIEPVVRWASKVILIDKMLCKVMYSAKGQKEDNHHKIHWNSYKRTIRLIYKTWAERCASKRDSFEIVTFEVNRNTRRAQDQLKVPSDPTIQIEELAADLCGKKIPRDFLRIRLKPFRDQDPEGVTHDRYLVTSQNVILNFSRGFDLITSENCCRDCTVSLYTEPRANSRKTVSKVLAMRDVAPRKCYKDSTQPKRC